MYKEFVVACSKTLARSCTEGLQKTQKLQTEKRVTVPRFEARIYKICS